MQSGLVDAGRLGRKTGRGVYSYTDEIKAEPAVIATGKVNSDRALLEHVLAEGSVILDGVYVGASDGRTASQIAAARGAPAAILDFMRDIDGASVIAFAASDDTAADTALLLASRCGKDAVRLADRPGLVVLRTLLQLANCAADAVRDRVADADAIDVAMMNGVNCPFGPLAWARQFGFARVAAALDAIAEETGEAIYRPGEWLRSAARRRL
jgi:3-hydroxybutyryl-CoA dehydrogenase